MNHTSASASASASVASASASVPALDPLRQMHQLIEQWGARTWHQQKEQGTDIAVSDPSAYPAESLQLCEDGDWVGRKGDTVMLLLQLRSLCERAMLPKAGGKPRIRNSCQCKSNSKCTSGHCKCVRGNRLCTAKCDCKGLCRGVPAPRLVGIELSPAQQ